MAIVTDSSLRAAIKAGTIDNLYYFYGKDIAAVEKFKKALVEKTVKKGDEACNLRSFDGENFDINEFIDACEALPMFAEYVCCTVSNLNAENIGTGTLNRLIEFIGDIPDTTVLIFYYTSFDVTGGKKYPTTKNKKLMDAVSKKGSVCNFAYKTPDMLSKDIMQKVSKSGSSISKQTAAYLAQICGCDTMILENEISKLIAYSGNIEITKEIVELLCPRQIETTSFDLARAIARHDKTLAMRLLNDLSSERIDPISIMYAITGNMVDLYRAKVALGSGKAPSEVTSDFGYPANIKFRVDNAFRDVRTSSLGHLRKCMQILTETDVKMKSLKTDNMTLLEEAIIRMLSSK
ncbi:MAG: DNA polymerase III subunit delta [Oscillospiraceae bacterium]|nr:DNA polymerase III subunit delta [Oscillospiraceae bacterium]